MLKHIDNILQQNCLVDQQQSLLLGLSGGPDSLFLLHALHKLGYALVAAHLIHGLRPESQSEARSVKKIAASLDVPITVGEVDVASYADNHTLSVEEAARILRYRFLFDQAVSHNVSAVAVGHTADDQVETVLMHLLRGSGLPGLGGMQYRALPNAWSRKIPLLRPILGVWRSEIELYIQKHGLNPVQDRTNLDVTYFRNRIRHELIPSLETYNPRVRDLLWRTADVLRADEDVLVRETEKVWEKCLVDEGHAYLSFEMERLQSQHLAFQRRILRKGIERLRPGIRDLDYLTISRGIEFIQRPSVSRKIELIAGVRMLMEENCIYLAGIVADLPHRDWPQVLVDSPKKLGAPGRVSLGAGWMITAHLVDDVAVARELALSNQDPNRAWIDMGDRDVDLFVRSRKPGDRMKPLGLDGHSVKLSDLMINEKLPRRARDRWPVVCDRHSSDHAKRNSHLEEIIWIPGLRLAHPYRVRDDTQRVVRLQLERDDQDSIGISDISSG